MTTPSPSDFSESTEKITKLNLPPKPVLSSSQPVSEEPPPLPVTASEKIEELSGAPIKRCSHRRSRFLSLLVALSALLALGVQVWIFFQHHNLGTLQTFVHRFLK